MWMIYIVALSQVNELIDAHNWDDDLMKMYRLMCIRRRIRNKLRNKLGIEEFPKKLDLLFVRRTVTNAQL